MTNRGEFRDEQGRVGMGGRVRLPQLAAMRSAGQKIVMVTAYDYTMARLMDQAGVDALLVGDSVGQVVAGYETTLPVTMEHMVYHTAAVRRGASRPLVIADLPFLSYQVSPEHALLNAGRLLKEGGADAVKLEGGREMAPTVRRLVEAGIPVVGHIGLTPQHVHRLGGYRVQGRSEADAERLLADAKALEEAGAACLVLELVPSEVARRVTEALSIPTVGIGAGPHCDGQVLVSYDMLGLNEDFKPRFLKRYAQLGRAVRDAVAAYAAEVRAGTFPGAEHSYE